MGGEEKKQLNWEDVEDQRERYMFRFIEFPEETVFESNFYFSAYHKFIKEHNKRFGFNEEHFFPKRLDNLLSLKSVPLSDSKIVFEACKAAVDTVLDYLQKKNEHNLILVRFIRANYRSDFRFFVTFEAKTKAEGLIEEYQSVIFRHLHHDKIVLHSFEKAGAVKGMVRYDCREKYNFAKIGGVKRNDFKRRDEYIAYRRYAKQHDASEGFDIRHFPRQLDSKKKTLKHLCISDTSLFEDCKVAVQDVLQYLKTKDEHDLILIRVIKANYTSDFLFYVTFEAKKRGVIEEYQSVFSRHCMHGKITLHMFRKKGAVKGAVQMDGRESYSFISIGGAKESDFKTRADFDAYQIYAKEHDDSEGFDIEYFIPPLLGGLFDVLCPVKATYLKEYCETAVENVLEYLERKKECDLELVEISKANYNAAYQFFVTFEAKVRNAEDQNEYQAVISYHCVDGEICLLMFRKKGEKLKVEEVVLPIDDERDEYEFVPGRQFPRSEFRSTTDFCNYEKYLQEHNSSEGFDIKTYISLDVRPAARILLKAENELLEFCKEALVKILEYLKSQYEENLELVEITKANYKLNYLFFVTFLAKDKVLEQISTYQSVIFHSTRGLIELNMFRKKGDI